MKLRQGDDEKLDTDKGKQAFSIWLLLYLVKDKFSEIHG